MTRYLLIVLLLLTAFCATAQKQGQARIDSLVQQLPALPEDTNKVKMLYTIANVYRDIDPDKGISYGLQAIAAGTRIGWKKGTGTANIIVGANYDGKSDAAKTLEYFTNGLTIFTEIDYKTGMAGAYQNIGYQYEVRADYPKALEYDFRALKVFEDMNSKTGAGFVLGNIGNIYQYQNDHRRAREYYFKALDLLENNGQANSTANTLSNLANSHKEENNYAKATEYAMRSLKVYERIDDRRGTATALQIIGTLYRSQHLYDSAIAYHMKALAINQGMGNRKSAAECLTNLGLDHLSAATDTTAGHMPSPAGKVAGIDKAIEYGKQAEAVQKETPLLVTAIANNELLAAALKMKGNYKEALAYYEANALLKDSLFSTDNKVKLANIATRREAELKDKQIKINELAITAKRNERVIFAGGIALLVIVALALYRNYKTQKKTNKIQQEALSQKEMLMKEIHHRVKNNLQVISTLLELQLGNVTDTDARDAITESTSRVKAISLIHQKLYQQDDIATINCTEFVTELFHQVRSAFNKPGQQVKLHAAIPDTLLDIDTAVPLGLILNELMTNSYKYAFYDADGSVDIALSRRAEGYDLTYRDSGPGLPAGLDICQQKSLGMNIMISLARQLAGSFSYEPMDRTFTLKFKDIAGRKETD